MKTTQDSRSPLVIFLNTKHTHRRQPASSAPRLNPLHGTSCHCRFSSVNTIQPIDNIFLYSMVQTTRILARTQTHQNRSSYASPSHYKERFATQTNRVCLHVYHCRRLLHRTPTITPQRHQSSPTNVSNLPTRLQSSCKAVLRGSRAYGAHFLVHRRRQHISAPHLPEGNGFLVDSPLQRQRVVEVLHQALVHRRQDIPRPNGRPDWTATNKGDLIGRRFWPFFLL